MEQNKDETSAAVRGEAVAEFNINDMMIVTLTEYGTQIWNRRYDGIPIPRHLIPEPVSAGYVLKDQMWDLMHTFGPHIYLGGEMPFLNAVMAHEKVSARAADALDSQPTEPAAEIRARVRDAVIDNLTCLYHCGRTWSAWNVGTMGEDDFSPAAESEEITDNITDAVMAAFEPASSQPTDGGVRNG